MKNIIEVYEKKFLKELKAINNLNNIKSKLTFGSK